MDSGAFIRGFVDELEKSAIEGPSLSKQLREGYPRPGRFKGWSPNYQKRKHYAKELKGVRKVQGRSAARVLLAGRRNREWGQEGLSGDATRRIDISGRKAQYKKEVASGKADKRAKTMSENKFR
jgi:hypothetical protein